MEDFSRATYIKSPLDKPLGLDMKSFEQNINAGTQKRDLEIINEVME